MMNGFDQQDDILSEIKRKKSATATTARARAVSEQEPKMEAEQTETQNGADPGPAASPAQQPITERISKSSAAVSISQDEQWDQLWQSVATKQKKPVLFDYDADERAREAYATQKEKEAIAHRKSAADRSASMEQQSYEVNGVVRQEVPAAVAVKETASDKRSADSFEMNIPELDEDPKPRKKGMEKGERTSRHSLFQNMSRSIFEEEEESSSDGAEEEALASVIDDQEEQALTNRRRSKVDAFFANKAFDVEEQEDMEGKTSSNVPSSEPSKARRLVHEAEEDDPVSAEEMRREISKTRQGILIRMGISFICFALLFYFHLVKVHMLLAPELIWPEYHPLTFIAVNFGVLLVTVLANSSIVGGGLLSLFTFKPDTDSLTSLSVVASVVQGAVLTTMPKHVMDPSVHLYFFIPALALLCSNVGRLMYINRVDRGSRIVSGDYDKYAIMKITNTGLARELTRGLDMDDPVVAVSVGAKALTGYEDAAYSNDFSENLSRILAPICLVASIAVALAGYFLSEDRNAFGALTSFAALTAVCSPLTASIAASMPLGRMSKKLHKEGAMIAGYEAADELSTVSAVVLSATDLFTPKDITLFSVKPFAEKRIDEALLDAASLICATDSTLSGIFSNIIQGQKNLLRPVENVAYEDGMGMTAWVNKKRVLIGNRTLMQHHGIDTPSKDFEAKYCRDHRDILYLANSGELSAMFVLGYSANEEVQSMLDDLASQKIAIVVNSNDANVTAEKICRLYEFPMEDIRIVPAQVQEALAQYQQLRETAPATAAHMGTASSLVSTVCASYSARTAVVLAAMIQFIGIILGYGVLALFVFTGAAARLTPDLLGVYLAIWAVLVMAIPRLRRM